MWTPDWLPLYNRSGRRLLKLLTDMVFRSDAADQVIVVEQGFITDLGSVPRIPLVFDALGEIAIEPYVIHDLLYTRARMPRDLADKVLLEALEAVGVPWLKRRMIYLGVRVGGGLYYGG